MLHQALVITLFASAAPPTVTVKPVDDKSFAAVALKPGKPALVAFWATYCVPCLAELPKVIAMKGAIEKAGGSLVFVNVDPPGHPEQIQKLATQKGLPAFETLQVSNEDPQPFIDRIDKKWMGEVPFAAVFGRDGTLKKSFSGEQKPEDLKAALDEVLKQP